LLAVGLPVAGDCRRAIELAFSGTRIHGKKTRSIRNRLEKKANEDNECKLAFSSFPSVNPPSVGKSGFYGSVSL
jgi:hypothetical protein